MYLLLNLLLRPVPDPASHPRHPQPSTQQSSLCHMTVDRKEGREGGRERLGLTPKITLLVVVCAAFCILFFNVNKHGSVDN